MSNRGRYKPSQESDSYHKRTRPLIDENGLTFGKYRGTPLQQVIKKDPGYITWAKGSIQGFSSLLPKETRPQPKMGNKEARESDLDPDHEPHEFDFDDSPPW